MTVYSTTTGYLNVGESVEFMNAEIHCNSYNGFMNTTLIFPWGYSKTVNIGDGGYEWIGVWSDTPYGECYDGKYDYVMPPYYHRVRFDCTGITSLGGGRAAFTITVELYTVNKSEITTFYLNSETGNDSDTGINRDHAFKTLKKGAESVKDGGKLYIQAGDYRTNPGAATQIPPSNAGTIGIDYVIEGVDWTDEARFLCGQWPEEYLKTFEHAEWGQYAKHWNYNDETFNWTRGWHAQYCNFVSSDKLISDGYGMKILIDNDIKNSVYTGSGITLEEGWLLDVLMLDVTGTKATINVSHDGDVMETFVLEQGDDLIYEHTVKGVTLPIIVAHIKTVFHGPEVDFIEVEGIVQISSNYQALTT